jgi:alkanesulfonate monooxygenase SsuD/methylene tetrahydromethanopterin reductase-like flavin-dependent oxidoreductase (luciferase family)
MKTFRFGVNVGPSRSRAEWVEKARKLEDLGYATLTVPDHLSDFFAPMPALISAAEATKNLRVGTNVLNNDFRHPVLVAREAATVDLLTEGRLQLGLGAGHSRWRDRRLGHCKVEMSRAEFTAFLGQACRNLAGARRSIKSGMVKECDYRAEQYRTNHSEARNPIQR